MPLLTLLATVVQSRREAIERTLDVLSALRDELAFTPGTMANSKVLNGINTALQTVRLYKVKEIPASDLDEILDIQPLAKAYYYGEQILKLWDLQKLLNQDIRTFSTKLNELQASLPANNDNIGTAMSDAHEFMVFATLANEMQVEEDLNKFSILGSELRNDSGFFEGTETLEILKSAYLIQSELEKPGYETAPTVSRPTALSETTLRIAREWYKHKETHMPHDEKVG